MLTFDHRSPASFNFFRFRNVLPEHEFEPLVQIPASVDDVDFRVIDRLFSSPFEIRLCGSDTPANQPSYFRGCMLTIGSTRSKNPQS